MKLRVRTKEEHGWKNKGGKVAALLHQVSCSYRLPTAGGVTAWKLHKFPSPIPSSPTGINGMMDNNNSKKKKKEKGSQRHSMALEIHDMIDIQIYLQSQFDILSAGPIDKFKQTPLPPVTHRPHGK